jgi:hypothetical protein
MKKKFVAQSNANYSVQYTTNLVAPVWQQVQFILFSPGGPTFVSDPANPDAARFYRVLAN